MALLRGLICEVGCGAGEILNQLQMSMDSGCTSWGYEISPQAYELCGPNQNDRLHFVLGDLLEKPGHWFDVILLMDVIEHVEDYFGFLKQIKSKSRYKVLHIPLDLSVQGVIRSIPETLRQTAGHLHYFTKETALCVLSECGYKVRDSFYTCALELPAKSFKAALARFPRKVAFNLNPDFAARVLGGFSLLVLVE